MAATWHLRNSKPAPMHPAFDEAISGMGPVSYDTRHGRHIGVCKPVNAYQHAWCRCIACTPKRYYLWTLCTVAPQWKYCCLNCHFHIQPEILWTAARKNGPLLQIKMPDDARTKLFFLSIKCMGLVYAAMQCFLEVQSNAQLMTNKLLEMHEQRKRFHRVTAHHGKHCMPIGSVHAKL